MQCGKIYLIVVKKGNILFTTSTARNRPRTATKNNINQGDCGAPKQASTATVFRTVYVGIGEGRDGYASVSFPHAPEPGDPNVRPVRREAQLFRITSAERIRVKCSVRFFTLLPIAAFVAVNKNYWKLLKKQQGKG